MNRTFSLADKFYYFDKLTKKIPQRGEPFQKKTKLPVESSSPYALVRKLIIPKQINDRIWVSFRGDFSNIHIFAGGIAVFPDENGLYEITGALKTGKTPVTAFVEKGRIDALEVTVKRF